MGILKCDDMVDASGQQELEYPGGCHSISDVPGIFVKPSPDGGENIAGKNMNMGIDYRRKSGRNP
jgi:hypothetical protein